MFYCDLLPRTFIRLQRLIVFLLVYQHSKQIITYEHWSCFTISVVENAVL